MVPRLHTRLAAIIPVAGRRCCSAGKALANELERRDRYCPKSLKQPTTMNEVLGNTLTINGCRKGERDSERRAFASLGDVVHSPVMVA